MGVVLAFYKGKGDWLDWLIRLFTRSQYSHVEYVQDSTAMDDQGRHECWSSSFRDGGVRANESGVSVRIDVRNCKARQFKRHLNPVTS